MKTLFKRNKELEEAALEERPVSSGGQLCQRCAGKSDNRQPDGTEHLRLRIKELEKSLQEAQ